MNIGNLILEGNVILAPLAGVADAAFRLIAKRFGAALVYTEMVSAEGILRDNPGTRQLLDFAPEERPIGVQLFGSRPDSMALACEKVNRIKPDLVDLNCGCPVKKVVGKNGGAALLKDLNLLERMLSSMVASSDYPVTVKTRSGWDRGSLVVLEVARMAQDCGAAAVTVHPRTQKDGFSNRANWDLIAQVKQSVKIPVIGSGDVFSPQDAKDMLDRTGCDAVMIGRGSFGNPWIFSRTNHFVKHGDLLPEPSIRERIETCLEHLELSAKQYGEKIGVVRMRKHMAWYTSGMPKARELRQQLFKLETVAQIRDVFDRYLVGIKQAGELTPDRRPQTQNG
jgi:tRNA-dihydrouridine synthase B